MCEQFFLHRTQDGVAKQSPVFKQNYPPKMPGDCFERKNAALAMTFVG